MHVECIAKQMSISSIIKFNLLAGICLMVNQLAYSEHIVGGLISYECQGPGAIPNSNTYKLTIRLFYDCSNDNSYERNIEIGTFKGTGNTYAFHSKTTAAIDLNPALFEYTKSCADLIRDVCVNVVTYTAFVRDLPIISENYLISYERCCRNITISNITDPGRTGSTVALLLTPESQRPCNSSPQFENTLPIVACLDEELQLNLKGTDKEDDDITYELCTPFSGGGPRGLGGGAGNPKECGGISPDPALCVPLLKEVNWVGTNINALIPFPSSIPITLSGGLLKAKPNVAGQFILGVCIKEYRNGLLMTVQYRDLQFNFVPCNINLKAEVHYDQIEDGVPTIIRCEANSVVKIINTSQDSQYIKKVHWEFTGPQGIKISDSAFHFSKSFPLGGIYNGRMYINRGYNCSDSINLKLKINPQADVPAINLIYDSCSVGPVLPDIPIKDSTYVLDYGDGILDTFSNGSTLLPHQYKNAGTYTLKLNLLKGNESYCAQEITRTIRLYPPPALVSLSLNDSTICYPGTIQFSIKEIIDTTYRFIWRLSDGRSFAGFKVNAIFTSPEQLRLSLTLITPSGCVVDKTFDKILVPSEKPSADFEIENTDLTLKNPVLKLVNNSKKADTYRWDFGDNTSSIALAPTHPYNRTGIFTVTLYAMKDNGCVDSLSKNVILRANSDIYVPNIFTPNGDGQNDEFIPNILAAYTEYKLNVFNRWGGLVFSGTDPAYGWDGNNPTGQMAPPGVYIYEILISIADQSSKLIKGSITLIRN